jgi:hypothetical protein
VFKGILQCQVYSVLCKQLTKQPVLCGQEVGRGACFIAGTKTLAESLSAAVIIGQGSASPPPPHPTFQLHLTRSLPRFVAPTSHPAHLYQIFTNFTELPIFADVISRQESVCKSSLVSRVIKGRYLTCCHVH